MTSNSCYFWLILTILKPKSKCLNITLNVTSPAQCEAGPNSYVLVDGLPATFDCEYGLPQTGVAYTQIYKGTDIIFDYQNGQEATTKADAQGRSSFLFYSTGLQLTLTKVDGDLDKEPIRCVSSVLNPVDRMESQPVNLSNLIRPLPSESDVYAILQTNDTEKTIQLRKGFGRAILVANASSALSDCQSPTIYWTETQDDTDRKTKSCDGRNGIVDDTVCEFTIEEDTLDWRTEYVYQAKVVLYDNVGTEKKVVVHYGEVKSSNVIVGIVLLVLLVVLFIVFIIYAKCFWPSPNIVKCLATVAVLVAVHYCVYLIIIFFLL